MGSLIAFPAQHQFLERALWNGQVNATTKSSSAGCEVSFDSGIESAKKSHRSAGSERQLSQISGKYTGDHVQIWVLKDLDGILKSRLAAGQRHGMTKTTSHINAANTAAATAPALLRPRMIVLVGGAAPLLVEVLWVVVTSTSECI